MIHLFHGDNAEASRKELSKLREQFLGQEIVVLDGKSVTLTELKQATESTSLFGSGRLVIAENLLSKRLLSRPKETDELIQFIKNLPRETHLVFWEDKEIGKTILSFLPKTTDLALFRYPREVFTFLEAIRPGKANELIERLDSLAQYDSAEMIFAMLVRQFRYLIMVKDLGKEVAELSPWQISKFMQQAGGFTLKDLLMYYRQLLEIDVKIKTGATPFNLTQELRLFLIQI